VAIALASAANVLATWNRLTIDQHSALITDLTSRLDSLTMSEITTRDSLTALQVVVEEVRGAGVRQLHLLKGLGETLAFDRDILALVTSLENVSK
jgi:hypothetical protein